ncbi:MAG: response regulator [Ruminococcaceae bacterium]|nr:response regulator [Oscillospiraceae bacterium]
MNVRETEGKTVRLRNTLPANVRDGMHLCCRSQRQNVTVYVNGEERGNYRVENFSRRKAPPSAFLLVDLYDGDANGVVEIEIISMDGGNGRYHTVTYGYGNNVWYPYIQQNLSMVMTSIVLTLLGLLTVGFCFYVRKRMPSVRTVLYLGEAILVAGMWSLSESAIRQLLFRAPSLSNVFSFLLIEILPAFVMMYFNELQKHRYEKYYVAMETVILIQVLVNSVLNAAGVADYYNTLDISHSWAALAILLAFVTLVLDGRSGRIKEYFATAMGMLGLAFFGALELLDFYFAATPRFGLFLGIGLIFLLGATVLQTARDALRDREQKTYADNANRAKSSFLANMSHEIRTPINAILGMDEMILRESSESDILTYAENIENAGKTLLTIINDILDFSKVEEGKMEIVPTQYNLSTLINDLVNMTRGRAEKKGLRFEVQADERTPHLLYGDEIRIRQCVINILTNAVKYTEKGSVKLEIGFEKLSEDKISLRFSVTDTGIGMKEEDLERLFSPFARIEEARNYYIEGTGLGMSITKHLLSLMGSELEVHSVYGEGSTFAFSVEQPVVKWSPIRNYSVRLEGDGAQRAAYSELFHAPRARILVVDDMAVNLTLIKGLLKKTQITVDTATSGYDAVELVKQHHYDVIFIDHMMPGMDGIETLQEMKKLPGTEETEFIALTANAISGSRELYLDVGFSDYLSKPVDSRALEKMLMDRLPLDKLRRVETQKQRKKKPEQEKPEPEETEPEEAHVLPDWLGETGEIDVSLGLKFCGTEETYLDTLKIYAGTALSFADEVEACYAGGDVALTALKMHALKSTSRAIGAGEISAMAERLEMAGKAGDTRTLDEELDGLLARCRALGHHLAPLAAPEKENAPDDVLPPLSEAQLQKTYGMIRALLSEFEYDRAAEMLGSLASYRLPDGEGERLAKMRQAADNFEWEELEQLLPDAPNE